MRQWFTKSVIRPLARELIDLFNFKTRGLEIDKYQEYFKWIRKRPQVNNHLAVPIHDCAYSQQSLMTHTLLEHS